MSQNPYNGRKDAILVEGSTIREIEFLFKGEGLVCNNNKIRHMQGKLGIDTIEGMRQHILGGKWKERRSKRHDVILPSGEKASLTAREIWEGHPHKDRVTMKTVSGRICTQGSMDPSLWDDLKRGGAPKGFRHNKDNGNFKGRVATLKEKTYDRINVCYRRGVDGVVNERCIHYWELTEAFGAPDKVPERCSDVCNGICHNYNGRPLKMILVDPAVIQDNPELMRKYDSRITTGR